MMRTVYVYGSYGGFLGKVKYDDFSELLDMLEFLRKHHGVTSVAWYNQPQPLMNKMYKKTWEW